MQARFRGFVIFLLCLSAMNQGSLAAGGIYKWTDAEGKVHFGDHPPAQVNSQPVGVRVNSIASPPRIRELTEQYLEDLSRADGKSQKRAKRKKVVMYSATWCGVCKRAKRYFKANRIPYREYDVEKSAKGKRDYKKLNGHGVPIILVGSKRMDGFSQAHFERLYSGKGQ